MLSSDQKSEMVMLERGRQNWNMSCQVFVAARTCRSDGFSAIACAADEPIAGVPHFARWRSECSFFLERNMSSFDLVTFWSRDASDLQHLGSLMGEGKSG